MSGEIRYELIGKVARLTLSDPTTLNAISYPMCQQFTEALKQASNEARAVILTGEGGRSFCSGTSVKRMGEWPEDSLRKLINPLLTALRDLSVPLVTSVNGLAAGIGCSIALMGDIILASERAFFLQAFGQLGLVPDGNASFVLPRLIGRARAAEMLMLGERLPAPVALEWGLINRVFPGDQLADEAMRVAEWLGNGPMSLGHTRKLIWHSLDTDWHGQLEAEASEQEIVMRGHDHREGVAAFAEKRPPIFQGR